MAATCSTGASRTSCMTVMVTSTSISSWMREWPSHLAPGAPQGTSVINLTDGRRRSKALRKKRQGQSWSDPRTDLCDSLVPEAEGMLSDRQQTRKYTHCMIQLCEMSRIGKSTVTENRRTLTGDRKTCRVVGGVRRAEWWRRRAVVGDWLLAVTDLGAVIEIFLQLVVMVAWHSDYTKNHWIVVFQMVKVKSLSCVRFLQPHGL